MGRYLPQRTTLMYREKTSKIEMWSLKYDCASNGAKSVITRHQHYGRSELGGAAVPPEMFPPPAEPHVTTHPKQAGLKV